MSHGQSHEVRQQRCSTRQWNMRPLIDGGTPMKEEDHQRQQAFLCDINLGICKH